MKGKARFLILLCVLFLPVERPEASPHTLMSEPSGPPKIIYVDDDAAGKNNGSSWENAYTFLQDALADANSSEKPIEIRVAQGIYKPNQGTDVPYPPTWPANLDYRVSFNLINDVAIKGGYTGFAEPDPNVRDIELYETILSGDLNGDDVDVSDPCDLFNERTRFGNSQNVVVGGNTDETAVLDGFTITGGNIWVIPSGRRIGGSPIGGAGMLISSGNPTLINCTLTANVTGNSGGGLLICNNSNPTLTNCTFTRNYAGSGGGIFSSGSSPTFIDCIFGNNYVEQNGSGMFSYDGNPKLINCTFRHNRTSQSIYSSSTNGGGMYNRNSNPVLTDCAFIENSAVFGGGMYNRDSDIELNTGEFVSNTSSRYGSAICSNGGQLTIKSVVFENNYPGAIDDYSTNGSMFTNCTFTGNSSRNRGGAVLVYEATFSNCVFAGNRAFGYYWNDGTWHPGSGGAIFNMSTTFVNNCTFIKNWAEYGDAIYCLAMGTTYVNNCIFWGSKNQIYVEPYWPTFVCYSDIQGGWPGEGNIDVDPLFVNPGYWDPNSTLEDPNDDFWVEGDYHLKSQAGRWDPKNESWVIDDVTSPCIDAGDPNSPVAFEPYPNGGVINTGAYGGTAEASMSPSGIHTKYDGEGKIMGEMQVAGTFLNTGWDFMDETENGTEDIWWILEGQDYPRLYWELVTEVDGVEDE